MTDPTFLLIEAVLLLHDQALQAYGGIPGLKDANALESALARPLNRLADADPTILDLFDLAATYAAAIAANHAFNDGNKRTAWSSRVLSLKLHSTTAIPPHQAADLLVALAVHNADETTFAAWLRTHRRPA